MDSPVWEPLDPPFPSKCSHVLPPAPQCRLRSATRRQKLGPVTWPCLDPGRENDVSCDLLSWARLAPPQLHGECVLFSGPSGAALANKCYFPQGLWDFDVKNSLVMEVIGARKIKTEEGRAWDLSHGSSCWSWALKLRGLGGEDVEVGLRAAPHVTQVGVYSMPGRWRGAALHYVPDEYNLCHIQANALTCKIFVVFFKLYF